MRMGLGWRFGPVWVSTGGRRRRYRRSGGGNWLGWLAILAGLGWLMSMCDPHPNGDQPTQIAPPLAPVTTTPCVYSPSCHNPWPYPTTPTTYTSPTIAPGQVI